MASTDEQARWKDGVHEQVSPEQEGVALVERINDWRQQGRVEEALVLCDEALPRFAGAQEPAMELLALRLSLSKALCLSQLQRNEEALVLCDELLRRYEGADRPEMRLRLARTLSFKAYLLEELNRSDEALRLHDELLRRYDGADDEALMESVATAMSSKAAALRSPEARITAFKEVVRRFKSSSVAVVRAQAALAAAQMVLALRRLGRREQEILSGCDEVLQHVGATPEPGLLRAACLLLSLKAQTLEEMNRGADAQAAYDETLRLLENERSVESRDDWARTLLNKAFHLKQQERLVESLSCYDTLVLRLGTASEASLRERAAGGLMEKAQVLERLGRLDEALSTFDEILQRWGADGASEVRVHAAEALLDKGLLLLQRQRVDEAVSSLREGVRRWGDSADEAVRERAARALLYEAVGLLGLKRDEAGQAALDEALRRFGDPAGAAVLVQAARALMDKDVLVVDLGLLPQALSVFDTVLSRFAAPSDALRAHVVQALNRTRLVLLNEARRRWMETRERPRELLEQARLKAVAVLELEPDNPIHLGQAGYLSFLTGHREVARGFLRKAFHLGGAEQKRFFELESSHPFPEDPEFHALVLSLSAGLSP